MRAFNYQVNTPVIYGHLLTRWIKDDGRGPILVASGNNGGHSLCWKRGYRTTRRCGQMVDGAAQNVAGCRC